jgi:hypothetical protein
MQTLHLGVCHQVSQLRTAAWVDLPSEYEPGAQRWVFYACNVLGDPVTPVWESIPTSPGFEVVGETFAGNNELVINSSANNPDLCISLIDRQHKLLGFVDSLTGTKVLHLYPTIRVPDTLFLVSSGRNIIPDTVPVIFQRPTQATLVFEGFTISNGTNNYVVSGKPVDLEISIANVGLNGATHCTAIVSALTPGISVEGFQLTYGTVNAGQVSTPNQTISFAVPADIPDGANILFQVDILINNNIHHADYFHIPVRAPVLAFGQVTWIDAMGGNGNGVPERGEIVILTVPVHNFGSAQTDTVVSILSLTEGNAEVLNGVIRATPILPSQTMDLKFAIHIDGESAVGETISVQVNIVPGGLSHQFTTSIKANLPVEEFGISSFTLPVWTNNSASPWTFSSGGLDNGYCLRSGVIGHNQSTQVSTTFTLEQPDKISFWIKTSCEYSGSMIPYDFLEFEVNGTRIAFWDNVPQWTKIILTLQAGTNQLVWRYNKDISVSVGQDAVWIDRIVFPPVFEIPVVSNNPPVISHLTDTVVAAGQNVQLNFSVSDPDDDAVTVTLLNSPVWLSLTQTQGHWRIQGTVPQAPQPDYHFLVIANDGKQAAFKSIRLIISGSSGLISDANINAVMVYPNPTSTYCILSGLPPGQKGTITLINSQGECERLQTVVSDDEGKIVLEKFGNVARKGLYLLHYQFGTCKGTTVLLID